MKKKQKIMYKIFTWKYLSGSSIKAMSSARHLTTLVLTIGSLSSNNICCNIDSINEFLIETDV